MSDRKVLWKNEFMELFSKVSFTSSNVVDAISLHELGYMDHRFDTQVNQTYPSENRNSISNLTFDAAGSSA